MPFENLPASGLFYKAIEIKAFGKFKPANLSNTINGDVKSNGNIEVKELNAQKVVCNNITDCYKMEAETIECAGNVASANLTCGQIIYKHE